MPRAPLRFFIASCWLLACSGCALPFSPFAQSKNGPQGAPNVRGQLSKNEQLNLPGDQKIERLQQDGSTVQIDELRVGGQTQAISVQPKLPLPAYQVLPEDGTRCNGTFESDASKRPSVWNIFNF